MFTINVCRCWGLNFNGQAGVGTDENVFVPTQVLGVGPIKMVSSGYYHTCAVTTEGFVHCFGYNANGQLGNGNTEDQNTPQVVSLGGRVDSVVTGRDHTCAIMMDESLKVRLLNQVFDTSGLPVSNSSFLIM
jgi:alpha-tubulin suppressor-like RCC1 family protein